MHGGLGGHVSTQFFPPSRYTLSSSNKIYKSCVQILEGVQNIMCACKNHPSDNRGPTNLPELQVSVSGSLQVTAELEYPKCNTRRSVAHCSRDVANGSMRMEASSYTSTSSVTRQSSCLAFPCRALPDQKYLLSSCIANSFLHVRSRITKMRGEGLCAERLTLTIRLFLLRETQQLCTVYQACKVLIQTCTVPLPPIK